MNSFFFSNIRSVIGPFLIGLVSFAVLSTVFLNQLGFIFDIHEIKVAFIIFSYTYTILPILFIYAWLANNNRELSKLLGLWERRIIVILSTLFLFWIGYFLFEPNELSYKYLLYSAGIFSLIILGYALGLCWKSSTFKSERTEFIIGYSIAWLVLVFFFYSNCKRLNKIECELSHIEHDLKVYDRIGEINSLASLSESTVRLTQLKLQIDDSDIGLAISRINTPQIINPELDSICLEARMAYDSVSAKIVDNLKIDPLTVKDIMSLRAVVDSIKYYNYSNITLEDRYAALTHIRDLDARIANMAILYGDLHKKDWSNLINSLKYKGLLLFSIVLLILLCLHFKIYMQNENNRTAYEADYHSIESNDKGYKLVEKKTYSDLPELRIAASGISLIILLIIPALKPTKASQVNLDKPFISFGLAQFFHEENNDNRIYTSRYSYTYNIDSVFYTDLQNNRIKVDVVDLSNEISNNKELSLIPQVDKIISDVHDDVHSTNVNLIEYLNKFTLDGDRRFKAGTSKQLLDEKIPYNH